MALTPVHRNEARPEAAPSHRPLDQYFDALATTKRLSAEDEVQLGRGLATARIALWGCLLGAPAAILRNAARDVLGDHAPTNLRRRGGAWPKGLAATLATADRNGDLARKLCAWARATPDAGLDLNELARAEARLQALRNRFIAANLGLVVSIARRYERRMFSLSDLIQEGNTGLLKAVDRYDPERGTRFSTYAVWWIRHAIGRGLSDRGREIRLPVHVAERQQTLLKARTRFELARGRTATSVELAEATGFTEDRVKALLEVEYTRAVAHDPNTKTATPVRVDELAAPNFDLDDELDADAYAEGIRDAVEALPAMQQEIIVRRFGLDGAAPMTLREVGKLHDLSRERIRQLQVRALTHMRQEFERRGLVA